MIVPDNAHGIDAVAYHFNLPTDTYWNASASANGKPVANASLNGDWLARLKKENKPGDWVFYNFTHIEFRRLIGLISFTLENTPQMSKMEKAWVLWCDKDKRMALACTFPFQVSSGLDLRFSVSIETGRKIRSATPTK